MLIIIITIFVLFIPAVRRDIVYTYRRRVLVEFYSYYSCRRRRFLSVHTSQTIPAAVLLACYTRDLGRTGRK